jgi:hypothetical protein
MAGSSKLDPHLPFRVPEPDLEKIGDYSWILFAIEQPTYMVELREQTRFS